MSQVLTEDQVFFDYLEHHGVKGMKWGVTRAEKKAARADNRAKNKAAKTADREAFRQNMAKLEEYHAERVDAARARVKSGATKADYKKAKAEYSKNKEKLGSYEAKKILNKAKARKIGEIEQSKMARDGKEEARRILLRTGVSLLIGVAKASSQQRRY